MVVASAPAPGLRGFQTFVPPPEGCTGWGPGSKSAQAAGILGALGPSPFRLQDVTQSCPATPPRAESPAATASAQGGGASRSASPKPHAVHPLALAQAEAAARQPSPTPSGRGLGDTFGVKSSSASPHGPDAARPDSRLEVPGGSSSPPLRRASVGSEVSVKSGQQGRASPSGSQGRASPSGQRAERAAAEAAIAKAQAKAKVEETPSQVVLDLLAQDPSPTVGPVQGADHMRAAATADVQALSLKDQDLHAILQEDPALLAEAPDGQAAFELYCATLSAFDSGPKLVKEALRAVIRDDVTTIDKLLAERTIRWDTRNAGGQTLLELAHQRCSLRVRRVLEDAKAGKRAPSPTRRKSAA